MTDRIEQIAKFLFRNYPIAITDCTNPEWDDLCDDCREGWLCEAEAVYEIATRNPDDPA